MNKIRKSLFLIEIILLISLSVLPFYITGYHNNSYNIKSQSLDANNLIDKSVGWVMTHGEDHYNETIVGYSSTIDDLQNLGANFSLINSEINNVLLSSYDILVIEEGGTEWQISELSSLKSWVENGGALYILGDLPGISQSNVSKYFNVYYNHTDALDGLLTILNSNHSLFENVTNVESFYPSASLDESKSIDSLEILAITDDGAPIIATLLVKRGHILWNVDSDGIINDFNIGIYDHRQLANNSWIWLATPSPYTPGDGGDNIIIIVIIISSIAGVAVIGTIIGIYIKKKK